MTAMSPNLPVELLLSIGEELSVRDLPHLLETTGLLHHLATQDKDGILAINSAAVKGNQTLMKIVLNRGADPNSEYHGRTALQYAASRGHLPVINTLLEKEQA